MKNSLLHFFLLVKNIFTDIFFLYKNFFHWNISKIIIFFAACVVGFLLSLPFFLFSGILAFIDPIEWGKLLSSDTNIYIAIANNALVHPFYVISEILLFAIGILFLFLGISYHIILESNLYLHYFKKEKLPYKNNHYFHASKIYTYLGILGWILGYLLLPIILLVVVFLILFICYSFLFLPEVILSIIMFIVLVGCVIWFLYLSYRLTFSYLIFMDADHYDENKPSKFYVQKSLEKTSGKVFFKFVGVFIVFAAVLAPFNAINVNIDNDIAQIKDYFAYETGQIDITDENELGYYEYLKSAFSEISDDQLISNLRTLYVKQIGYGIFFFLLISGVFTMVLTSFYKRALGLQWGKIKEEDQPIKKKSKKKEKVDKSVKKKKTDKGKKKKKTSATKKSKKNTKKK